MRESRIICSSAPGRICDIGGWTDTWFARRGAVLNLGVGPRVHVQLRPHRRDSRPRLTLHAEDWGETYTIDTLQPGSYQHDPIVEAAVNHAGLPEDLAVELTVATGFPLGMGAGISSAIVVATLAALDRLTPGRRTPHELARAAHHVETELAGEQAGVQDHVTAACGGIRFIEIEPYPHWTSSAIQLPDTLRWELQRRLTLVYMGQPHDASEMHKQVIPMLTAAGPDHPTLERIRHLATQAASAMIDGDLPKLGQLMTAATDAQADLHPSVVTEPQRRVIDIARDHLALGWKQNGAGGQGGSITLLSGDNAHQQHDMQRALNELGQGIHIVPVYLDPDPVRVWETQPDPPPHTSTQP